MAIKDQCKNCRNINGTSCPDPDVFDGSSCCNYAKKIDLDKHNDITDRQASNDTIINGKAETVETSESLKESTEIHGWLSFFLFSIVCGGLLSMLIPIFQFNSALSEYDNIHFVLIDLSFGIMLGLLSLYTLYSFTKRKSDAVFLAKTYVILAFSSNLLALYGGEFESSGFGSLPHTIRSLLWGVIWFLYLCMSKQVATIIPKSFRKVTNLDYYIIASFIIIPLFFLGTGIISLKNNISNSEAEFLEKVVLAENEYSDGKIIFKSPSGFTCNEKQIQEPKLTIFELEDAYGSNITICSDYDEDKSWKNVNDYWKNWKDEESARECKTEVLTTDHKRKSKFEYFYKSMCFHMDNNVYWRFVMLFDNNSNKVCVISSYDLGDESYVEELVNSIRF